MPKNSPTFLTLPIEIRLRVYDLLLVSGSDQKESPFEVVETPYLQHILVGHNFPLEPGILQTCKQIHHEANIILYSQNIFSIGDSEVMFGFIGRVGPANVKLMKSISVWVPPRPSPAQWLELATFLAKEATGLRYIEITWPSSCASPSFLLRAVKGGFLHNNPDFERFKGWTTSPLRCPTQRTGLRFWSAENGDTGP